MNILDVLVFIISVLGIFLEMWQKPLFWLAYIIGSIIFAYEFITSNLYGSALLQIIYIVLSIYGWYRWTDSTLNNKLEQICHVSARQMLNYVIAMLALSMICYVILKHTGDSDYLVDAILTAVCIVATYMAALKQIESWFVFGSTVLISVPLYYSYHLYFTCISYLIFGILDISGGIKWLSCYKKSLPIKI
ncbi:MAG: nicotinamide mononucleotide transporter [Burkholderiales bacterium]|nr:nicotinamide mononucleotide transporter [Burkholderiales bacterium]